MAIAPAVVGSPVTTSSRAETTVAVDLPASGETGDYYVAIILAAPDASASAPMAEPDFPAGWTVLGEAEWGGSAAVSNFPATDGGSAAWEHTVAWADWDDSSSVTVETHEDCAVAAVGFVLNGHSNTGGLGFDSGTHDGGGTFDGDLTLPRVFMDASREVIGFAQLVALDWDAAGGAPDATSWADFASVVGPQAGTFTDASHAGVGEYPVLYMATERLTTSQSPQPAANLDWHWDAITPQTPSLIGLPDWWITVVWYTGTDIPEEVVAPYWGILVGP